MDIQKLVGSNIQKLRQAAKISQEELASRISVGRPNEIDQAYVSRLEAGEKNPTLDTLQKVATALSVEITALFKGAGK